MGPLVAPAGTVALSCVSLSTPSVAAARPLNVTAVAPVRSLPPMVTTVPTGPEVGLRLVSVSAGATWVMATIATA